MDLFDRGRYFSFHAPIKARTNSLLRYAACAYAAKQIGRCGGAKPILGGVASKQAYMETWLDRENVDWMLIAMRYYDLALQQLREALEEQNHLPRLDTNETPEDLPRSMTPSAMEVGNRPLTQTNPPKTSDELLAATAIMCEVEAMDANGSWGNHLNGTKSLLDVAEVGMRPADGSSDLDDEPKFAGARKAIFWNFARQDFSSACKRKTLRISLSAPFLRLTHTSYLRIVLKTRCFQLQHVVSCGPSSRFNRPRPVLHTFI